MRARWRVFVKVRNISVNRYRVVPHPRRQRDKHDVIARQCALQGALQLEGALLVIFAALMLVIRALIQLQSNFHVRCSVS